MAAQSERIFLEENDVMVSNTRFVVPPQLFAMASIVSVTFTQISPNRLLPIALTLVGLIFMGGNGGIYSVGVPVILGVAWLASQKTQYCVVLSGASGETRALTSTNKAFVSKVVSALNQAIISRG